MTKIDFCFYLIEMYNFMRIKCEKCSHIQEITLDAILFDDEDEKDPWSSNPSELGFDDEED